MLRPASLLLVLAVVGACGDNLAPDEVDAGTGVDASLGVDLAAVPTACTTERATIDRPDDHGYDQIRVLYVVPSDAPDDALDTSGRICASVRTFATWFHGQHDAFLRFDTTGGLVDIGFVRLARTDLAMRGDDPSNADVEHGIAFVRNRIERELAAAGLIDPHKLYAVYYGGTSAYSCGGGAYPPVILGHVGAFYLRAAPYADGRRCDAGPWGAASLAPAYVDYAMLHELVHTLGFVGADAPHQHSMGHVFDPEAAAPARDLMYTPRPGMADPPWATNGPAALILDIARDDYAGTTFARDLLRSSLLAPLPAAPQRPLGW